MAKYIGNPVEVDAYVIESIGPLEFDKSCRVECSEGRTFILTAGMTSREGPEVGGYVVIQADGYTYINPKHVFERKYHIA